MLFSSISFLFYFCPTLLLLYFFFRKNIPVANFILLSGSLLFYAWGEPAFIIVMLFSIAMNYIFGRLIDYYRCYSHVFLSAGIFLNLSLLFYYKYFSFLIVSVSEFFSLEISTPHIPLPLGISFFTFQAITYLVDLKREEIPVQKNIFNLALYVSLFPQLIAGPIVRYHDVEKQIKNRVVTINDFAEGVRRFVVGFSKKVLIANTFAQVADEIFAMSSNDFTASLVIFGMLAYTIQIYFDFSGYSDMAIGLGRMFGFHFLENFNYPYIAKNIREFWRRWHISLSTFLRDYLYIPLGGSQTTIFKTYRNLIITFLLCGLWHGAEWTFIIWGLYFGFFLVLERLFLGKLLEKTPKLFSWFYMIVVVMVGWLLFRAENIGQFLDMIQALYSGAKSPLYKKYAQDSFLLASFVLAVFSVTPIFQKIILNSTNQYVNAAADVFLLCVFVISVSFLVAGTYNPFIYFRF